MIGELIALLAVLTFVGSNVLFRKTEKEASPTFINFIRTAIGTVTFIIISIFLGLFILIFSLPWDLWVLLFLSFLFGQVIGDTSYFSAQKILGTTIALAISMTFPLFTFFLSLLFLHRPFEISMILSLILIGIGIIIIGNSKIKSASNYLAKNREQINTEVNDSNTYSSSNIVNGIIYGLFASLGWAIGLVIIDYATNRIDSILNLQGNSSIVGNVIRFPFALSILAVMVYREKLVTRENKKITQKRSKETWLLLIIASIIGTSLGAYLYTEAARVAGANIMSLLATSSPLFALPLTYWINKEKITKFGFVGVILTILGVIIILI